MTGTPSEDDTTCTHPNCHEHGKSPCEGVGCDGMDDQERTEHQANARLLDTLIDRFAEEAETEEADLRAAAQVLDRRWYVELVDKRNGRTEDVGAETVRIESGCLVFSTGGEVVFVRAAGTWLSVTPEHDLPATDHRWLVELANGEDSSFEDVGAQSVEFDSGCLVFSTGDDVVFIRAAGTWLSATPNH